MTRKQRLAFEELKKAVDNVVDFEGEKEGMDKEAY